MEKAHTLTVQQGINIQVEHLKDWEKVLKPEIYLQLEKWAKSKNVEAKTGYEILRGNILGTFVYTLMRNPKATKLHDF